MYRSRLLALAVLLGVVLVAPSPSFANTTQTSRKVVRMVHTTMAYTKPARVHDYLRGLLLRKARFTVLEERDGAGCKDAWLRIDEMAWVCSTDTEETDEAPGGPTLPRLKSGRSLPYTYVVAKDGEAYDSLADIAAEKTPRELPGTNSFHYRGEKEANGARYLRTRGGWIPADKAKVVRRYPFEGVDLSPEDAGKRLAFVTGKYPRVYDEAGRRTHETLRRRAYLGEVGPPIAVGKRTLYRLSEGRYVRGRDIGLVELADPPASVGEGEHWIDVDRSEQTLVAYEGSRPVRATVVSTSRYATPIGEFRIQKKRPEAHMTSRPESSKKWDVRAPWAMTLAGRFAMHAIYWHEDLGRPVSMGCVNLSPRDAKWVWDFTLPALPPGWKRIYTREGSDATLVRVRK